MARQRPVLPVRSRPAGISNLYRWSLLDGSTQRITDFRESGVRFPSIGPRDIVFEYQGEIWRYDLESQELGAVPITLGGDRPALRPIHRDLADAVEGGSLSPTGKGVVLEARGDLFLGSVEGGPWRNLTASAGVADRSPQWSPDGAHIAWWSDADGEYALKLWSLADDQVRTLCSPGAGWRYDVSWSPDSARVVYSSYDGNLEAVDVASGTVTRLAQASNVGRISATFSPGGRYLAWDMRHPERRTSAIYLYDFDEERLDVLTSGMFEDSSPTFDANGDWLYYLSSRTFRPTYADLDGTWIYRGTREAMAVPLRGDVESPLAPLDGRDDWIANKDKDKGKSKPGAKADDAETKAADGAVETADAGETTEEVESSDKPILVQGFEARAQVMDFPHGELLVLAGRKGGLTWFERAEGGDRRGGMDFRMIDWKREAKPKTILTGVRHATLTGDRSHALVELTKGWVVIEVAPDQKADETLDLAGLQGEYDPRAEWHQMLREVYRLYRDFFYDPGMHGVDWGAEFARYDHMLDRAVHREDLHYVIGEFIGELNVGHAYNRGNRDVGYGNGTHNPGVGLLGCDWNLENGFWRIGRVLGNDYDVDEPSPLRAPGAGVAEGDYLLAVDGTPVRTDRAVYAAFVGTAGRPVRLLVNSTPEREGAREVVVEPIASETALRYRTWVSDMRAYVAQRSGGRIGYVHVPDTGQNGQNELMRQFVAEHHAPALLVDERWNGGGQIPWRFTELLNRPTLNYWATRGRDAWEYPEMRHEGPKAMLINGPSGSGGDCFPYYFRQAGLGPLIGTRTWGGLVGISGNPGLIDGASVTVPTFGFFELDGTWGIENHGVIRTSRCSMTPR
ncbi:MAG: PDZ domain-containing protein [Planctomycetota bacterium]